MPKVNNKTNLYKPIFFLIAICISVLVVIFVLNKSQDKSQKQDKTIYFNIGTGGTTGVYLPVGSATCKLINTMRRNDSSSTRKANCGVQVTGGSLFNIYAVANTSSSALEVAIAQSDIVYEAFNGKGKFDEKNSSNSKRAENFQNLRSVIGLHSEVYTVIVRKSSDINSIDDFRGNRVNIGNPGSGPRKINEEILEAKGIDKSEIFVSELKASDQARALCNNKIDVMIYVAGHPNGATQEATATCDTRILDLSNDLDLKKMVQQKPYFYWVDVPVKRFYANQEVESIRSFGVKAILITNKNVPSQVINSIYDAVFNQTDFNESFTNIHQVFNNVKSADVVRDANVIIMHVAALEKISEMFNSYISNYEQLQAETGKKPKLFKNCIMPQKDFLKILDQHLASPIITEEEKFTITKIKNDLSQKPIVCSDDSDLSLY